MLLVVIGAAIVAIVTIRVFRKKVAMENLLGFCTAHALLCCFGLLVLFIGVGAPFHGYYEPVITKEYELAELIENTRVYVIEDSDRMPFFKYIASSYETGINDPYEDSNIEIVVSEKYEKPTLVKYRVKAKKGIFGLGLFDNSVEYKIHVTEENVRKLN